MTPEPTWVDLGLPSGKFWATHNLGAATPEEPGLYYSWGNVNGHAVGSGYDFSDAEYANTDGAAIDSNLTPEYDAATVAMGSKASIPSTEDFVELVNNTTHEWVLRNSRRGMLFTSLVNGKQLFIPAAGGYNGTVLEGLNSNAGYWSTILLSEASASIMSFYSNGVNTNNSAARRRGYPIRPVYTPDANRSIDPDEA